jgi:hypothetical protein
LFLNPVSSKKKKREEGGWRGDGEVRNSYPGKQGRLTGGGKGREREETGRRGGWRGRWGSKKSVPYKQTREVNGRREEKGEEEGGGEARNPYPTSKQGRSMGGNRGGEEGGRWGSKKSVPHTQTREVSGLYLLQSTNFIQKKVHVFKRNRVRQRKHKNKPVSHTPLNDLGRGEEEG